MFKIVLQIPEEDKNGRTDPRFEVFQNYDWVGHEGRAGPHLTASLGKDAETGEPALFLRGKAHNWKEVLRIVRVLDHHWLQ